MASEAEPKVVSIDRQKEEFFSDLAKAASPLKHPQFDNKHRWLLAFALGFKNGTRNNAMKRGTGGYFRSEQLDTYFDKPILRAVAVSEQKDDLSVISDWKLVYSIAEEYASGGAGYLEELSIGYGDFFKKLESLVEDELKAIAEKSDLLKNRP